MEMALKETQFQEVRANVELSDDVKALEAQLRDNLEDVELWMKKGQALRKQMLIREAIEAYSEGLTRDPFHALLYRHRGHALINIRRYKEGAADLELSARIDPSNWDTWYHLGLAYYLIGDYARAKKIYAKCYSLNYDNESLTACTDWYWLTLMHLGEEYLAKEIASKIPDNLEGVHANYYKRILVYNGLMDPEDVVKEAESLADHGYATQCYGISYFYELKGNKKRAHEILLEIARRDEMWSGFAESAAYERLKNWE